MIARVEEYAIFITDPNGYIMSWNLGAQQIFGHNDDEIIGKHISVLYIDADIRSGEALGNLNKALKKGSNEVQGLRVKKDGVIFWADDVFNTIYDDEGRLAGFAVISRDISQQKQTDEHTILEEAASTQAAILNALPPNIAVLNKKGKIIAVNESWKKLTLINNLGLPDYGIGYSYLALCDKAMGIDSADIDKIAKGLDEVINDGKSFYTLEYQWNAKGQTRWFQLMAAPLQDSKHQGAVVQHINITDRKLAEESLQQSEANLRSIFENTDLSIVLFDMDLRIVSFNTHAKNLAVINYGKKLKKGNSAFCYFPKSRKPFINTVAKRVRNKEIVNYETTYQPKHKNLEWYEVSWLGVVTDDGNTIGYILTLKDITAKKQADIEREKITADLVKRNADLEQFAYIISHNLRLPVANIIGLSDLLNNMDVADKDNQEVLKALSESINKLDSIVHDLNNVCKK